MPYIWRELNMVSDLLQQSMAAHYRAQQLRRNRHADSARESLAQAKALREQALALDPERKDPAWAAEQSKTPNGRDTHEELMAFYASELAKA
jgi:hypothetical protein